MLHRNVLAGDVHIFYNWAVADATALAALSLSATDIGKVAWQQDVDQYKALKNDVGPVWITLNPAAVSTLAASAITIADTGGYFTGIQVEAALQEVGASLASLIAADVALDGRLDTLEAKTLRYDLYLALGTEDTAITASASVAKVSFRVRRAFTLDSVFADLRTAQASGSIVTFDVKKNGTSIFSTLLTIDNTETDSATAATPAVLTGTITFASGDIITVFVTQCDAATAAAGAKITLCGSYQL